ncbi:MAG: OmpA family protein [Flavobacteriales bacterium]|nr:OmpA family protein [Flavobacteriales bacterium]
MKKGLLLCLFALGVVSSVFAQYGESMTEYTKFKNSEKKFNDWSVTVYGGLPLMQSADLTSFKNYGSDGSLHLGYEYQLGITKAITHAFGLQLLVGKGETNQGYDNWVVARTEYQQVSLLGDLNLTSIVRRVDNKSPYRWALHTYAGVGLLGYKTYWSPNEETTPYILDQDQPLNQASVFAQVGLGLKYKISRRFDAELRAMYIMSGDDEFDGGGHTNITIDHGTGQIGPGAYYPGVGYGINNLEENVSDNVVALYLGLSYKFGKHKEHLHWFDPLHELYPPVVQQAQEPVLEAGCMSGDNDQDGVCDDWDRELDSPAGCRVDGSGICLDTDLDGIIDLYDKCPTYPSTNKEAGGCPTLEELLDAISGKGPVDSPISVGAGRSLPPIEFELDSDKITGESIPTMENIVRLLKQFYQGESIIVEGHTDAYGKLEYNKDLSKRRVQTVIKYLGEHGIDTSKFTPVGLGQSDLKYPECDPASKCPDFKNRGNRRVVFKLAEE